VPLAEINTAGVIMAVKTANDEDNPSIENNSNSLGARASRPQIRAHG